VVTAGSNMAFMNAVLAIVDPGDEVIIPVPYYFNHEMGIVMANGRAATVPTTANYQLDLDAIADAITPRTKAVITVSPNNPTGVVYPEATLRTLNALCRDRGIFHLHDEAYEYFTYGGATNFSPGSIAGAGEHTISMFSLSKGYGMASWRVGYMVIPHRLWDAINKIQDTVLVCPPAISQLAGLAAVQVGKRHSQSGVAHLDRMRRVIGDALQRPGLPCDTPAANGAFYFFTRVRTSLDPMTGAERLIREHKVAAMPGSAFGAAGCHLRLSYGLLDDGNATEGVSRLVSGLRAITGAAPV
jgi:aspartate/methionine/tyrosine aminotransferase